MSTHMRGLPVLAVSSGTAGLHLALEALGIREGDEVILPTLTFTAAAEAIRHLGAVPVLVDIDPVTCNLTVDGILAGLTPKTKAVIPVHFGGLPCDMVRIWEVAEQYRLLVVEDATHALGSTYAGQPVGSWVSDASVFSFHATQCVTTLEGGLIVSPRDGVLARVASMRAHGIEYPENGGFTGGGIKASWEYDVLAPGWNYTMPDLLASIGLVQLVKMKKMRDRREWIARQYMQAFSKLPLILPEDNVRQKHSWHLYAIRLRKHNRNRFMNRMSHLGVSCMVHFKPLHQMTYWRMFARGTYPQADTVYRSSVSLPIYSKMTDGQVAEVIRAVKESVDSH